MATKNVIIPRAKKTPAMKDGRKSPGTLKTDLSAKERNILIQKNEAAARIAGTYEPFDYPPPPFPKGVPRDQWPDPHWNGIL